MRLEHERLNGRNPRHRDLHVRLFHRECLSVKSPLIQEESFARSHFQDTSAACVGATTLRGRSHVDSVDSLDGQRHRSPTCPVLVSQRRKRPRDWNNGAGAATLTVAARKAGAVPISARGLSHEGDRDIGVSRGTPANGSTLLTLPQELGWQQHWCAGACARGEVQIGDPGSEP